MQKPKRNREFFAWASRRPWGLPHRGTHLFFELRKYISLPYLTFDEGDRRIRCALCHSPEVNFRGGNLVKLERGDEKVYVHEKCGVITAHNLEEVQRESIQRKSRAIQTGHDHS